MSREKLYSEIKKLLIQKKDFKPYWYNGNSYLGIGEILTIDEMENLKADPDRKKELLIFGGSANEYAVPVMSETDKQTEK